MHRGILLALAAVFLSSSLALAQGGPPQLVGAWRGTAEVAHDKSAFTTSTVEFVIENQKGHLFTGTKKYLKEPKRAGTVETFSGVVLADGKTILFADSDWGYNYATLVAPDKLEIAYIHDGLGKRQSKMACYMLLTRTK